MRVVSDDLDMAAVNAGVKQLRTNYCACGCATVIPWRTRDNKPQRYSKGHHTRVLNPNTNRRPRVYTSTVVSIRFRPTDYQRVEQAAKASGVTVSEYVRSRV